MKFNNIIKIIILISIICICLYILYFSKDLIKENFEVDNNCSECIVKPSSGNCIDIYDISISPYPIMPNENTDVSLINTDYVFCPWESNCISYNTIQCCSNSNIFYNINKDTIKNFEIIKDVKNDKCSDEILSELSYVLIPNKPQTYYNILKLCTDVKSYQNLNKYGLFFKRIIDSSINILKDPNLTIEEVLDYQNILAFKMDSDYDEYDLNKRIFPNDAPREFLKNKNRKELTNAINERKFYMQYLNRHKNEKQLIQNALAEHLYSVQGIKDVSYIYKLSDSTGSEIDYNLSENEFINCSGEIKSYNNYIFSEVSWNELNFDNNDDTNINYFNQDNNKYFNQDNNKYYNYNENDNTLHDLNRLQNIPPDSINYQIISNYLNVINSFYNKKLDSLIAPKTLEYDIDSQKLNSNTFFVYNNEISNNYPCENSASNNKNFKYCGPVPYSL
tara:strand:+ start:1670 stop:3013 length:1344 start_codon:yes stop_codon:yes gene_type:complete